MRLDPNLLCQALIVDDSENLSHLIEPLLREDVQMPVGFEEYDHLLERAQALVKDQSPESVWALVEEAHLLIGKAETAYRKMNDREVVTNFGRTAIEKRTYAVNVAKKDESRQRSRNISSGVSAFRLLQFSLKGYMPSQKKHSLLGAFAIYRIATAIRSSRDRIVTIGPEIADLDEDDILHRSGSKRYVHVSKVDSVARSERQVVGRLLCDAIEAIAYAEGSLAEHNRRKKGNAQRNANIGALMNQVVEIYLSNSVLQSTSIENAAIQIHETFFNGLKPKASTIEDYIRPYALRRKSAVS